MTLPLYMTILGVIAFTAAIMGILGLFIVSRGVARFGTSGVINVFFWLIALASTARIMTGPREYLLEVSSTITGYDGTSALGMWILRLFSVGVVGVSVMAILIFMQQRKNLRGGTLLWVGIIAMYLAAFASSALGAQPAFIHYMLYTLLVVTAVIIAPPIEPEQIAVNAKRVLAFLMYGSLIMAVVSPSHYIEPGYASHIPGINFRLHGLVQHANTLGPLALLYLVLGYWVPGKRPWHLLGNLAALGVLVLAQSKTAYVSALLVVFALLAARLAKQADQELRTAHIGWVTVLGLAFLLTLLMAVFVFVMATNPLDMLYRIVAADSELATLTGRTDIWRITLDTWRLSPWFGYGPNLWDIDFRISHGAVLAAWHAHNQYLQALGESGIVGLIALLLYVGALLGYGVRFMSETRGVSLALVLLLLSRTVSEIPLKLSGLMDVAFMAHLTVFAVLLMLARRAANRSAINTAPALHKTGLPQSSCA